jgi:hypothetical protein
MSKPDQPTLFPPHLSDTIEQGEQHKHNRQKEKHQKYTPVFFV